MSVTKILWTYTNFQTAQNLKNLKLNKLVRFSCYVFENDHRNQWSLKSISIHHIKGIYSPIKYKKTDVTWQCQSYVKERMTTVYIKISAGRILCHWYADEPFCISSLSGGGGVCFVYFWRNWVVSELWTRSI